MKKLTFLFTLVCCAFSLFADAGKFIYSADGSTKGSGIRMLPSQAVNLKTGKVVLGLARLSDAQRAECGWYRVLPFAGEVGTNQVFVCTNYTFSVEGTATPVGYVKDKPVRVYAIKYSKLTIYQELCALNKWNEMEAWMKATNIGNVNVYYAWGLAQYLTDRNPLFSAVKSAAQQIAGLNDEEMVAFLKKCEDGKELVSEENVR